MLKLHSLHFYDHFMFFHTGSINYFYTVAFILTLARWRCLLQEQEEKVPKSAEPVSPFSSEVVQVQRIMTSAANRSIGSTTGFHNHGEGPY